MWARIGSLFILSLAAFEYSLNTQKMQPGVGSGEGGGVVWAVGVVRAGWGGVWAVGVVRVRGGVGTHWQPLNTFSPRKCEPSLGSGEEMRARRGAGGGVVRARGGVGTHWQPLNTL